MFVGTNVWYFKIDTAQENAQNLTVYYDSIKLHKHIN